jgi:hypothetical protein
LIKVYCFTSVCPSFQNIFRHIFLSNYWWQKSDIWSQASHRYVISWEAFLEPSDSYFLLQKTSIFALILWEEQRLNRFWSEKRCRNSTFTFGPPKKCPPFFFLIHTWWCENITASPCESSKYMYRCFLLIDWFTVEWHSFLNSKRFGQLLSILNSGLYGLNIKVSFHWSKDLNWHFCGKLFGHNFETIHPSDDSEQVWFPLV